MALAGWHDEKEPASMGTVRREIDFGDQGERRGRRVLGSDAKAMFALGRTTL